MSDRKYAPSGVLFKNNKKTGDKSPDMTGNLEISKEVLKDLITLANDGKPIKMRLAAWSRESEKGTKFLSMIASKDEEFKPKAKSGGKSRNEEEDLPF